MKLFHVGATAMGQPTLHTPSLPAALRAVRTGDGHELQVRRALNLAAARIEELEDQLLKLAAGLQKVEARGMAERVGVARRAVRRRSR